MPFKHFITYLVFTFFPLFVFNQNINIRIFTSDSISEFKFQSEIGKYDIISDNKIVLRLSEKDSCSFKVKKNKIKLYTGRGKSKGNHRYIQIRGRKQDCAFLIKPINTPIKQRQYNNDLHLNIENSQIVFH